MSGEVTHVAAMSRAALAALLVAACSSPPEEDPAPPPSRLELDTGIAWNVEQAPDGTLTFAEPRVPETGPLLAPTPNASPAEAALTFLEAHASAFALTDPRATFTKESEGTDRLGLRYASFLPTADDPLAPSGDRLTVHFERSGRLAFLTGRYRAAGTTRTSSLAMRASHPCFLEAHGHGVHYYAPPPLHDPADLKAFEVTASASTPGRYEMRAGPLTCTGDDASPVSSTDLEAWDTTGAAPGAAVDAYVHATKALAFYRTVLGRRSWDDRDGAVTLFVLQEPSTASWSSGSLGFGPPQRDRPSPLLSYAGAFDVVAHEIAHGVTEATLALALSSGTVAEGDHSGILNESISDIFAAFAEHWDRPGPGNTTIGEAVAAPGYPPTRDLAHPSRCLDVACEAAGDCGHRACPDHLSKLDPETDVHRSTGISSNAWHLMTVGGTNDTSNLGVSDPMGWETSLDVWYALVTSRAVPIRARFRDVALASVALARRRNQERAAACAWVATGVLEPALVRRFWGVSC